MIKSLKLQKLTVYLTSLLILVLSAPTGKSQTRSYTYKGSDYVLNLPSSKWHAVEESRIGELRTYFNYEDHGSVQLHIRRELVETGVTPAELIEQQRRWDRVSLRGYVKTNSEAFTGQLSGAKYGYEYVNAGKATAKLIYYLQADTQSLG